MNCLWTFFSRADSQECVFCEFDYYFLERWLWSRVFTKLEKSRRKRSIEERGCVTGQTSHIISHTDVPSVRVPFAYTHRPEKREIADLRFHHMGYIR